MQLVVSVPGHASFAIDDTYIVKVKKWPSPGQILPIEASAADPTELKILWDEMSSWEVGQPARAQQVAQAMNQQGPAPQGGAAAGVRGPADRHGRRQAGDAGGDPAVRGHDRHGPRR